MTKRQTMGIYSILTIIIVYDLIFLENQLRTSITLDKMNELNKAKKDDFRLPAHR